MSTTAPAGLLDVADPDPMLAVGRGQPDVPWTIPQRDRIYNVLLAGGQGSGKSAALLRLAMGDVLSGNTATVVLDMKGSLSERILHLTPPDRPKRWYDRQAGQWREGTKRLWYLDLGRPAFGLTPLRVEAGWTPQALADEFARIADAITRALLDLFPGQIMGSSEDLIERAVVGTMAIAWFEHTERCAREGVEATSRGFSGSFEVLAQMFSPTDRFDAEEAANQGGRRRVRPNRWHQAAGRACRQLPNLDWVAETLLYEIPRQVRDNLADIAKRMEAPANKIRPLVGAAASVRRFVGHPERLSLRSVIESHDTLVVNPRVELIGEDQAAILTNFIVHMLDLQLKRQLAYPVSTRPRVSLIIDEASRLVTDTLTRMVESHREAGLTVAAALQYVSQLGAYEGSAARREKIVKGVGNLLQTKILFRMSDSEDADQHTQIFRSVYETMVRADPTSRARMPFDPARMQTLADHHALVSLVCTSTGEGGLIDTGQGATRLPAFTTQTFKMPELEELSDRWRRQHLERQGEVFNGAYPENMADLAIRDVPAGLSDSAPPSTDGDQREASEAREVAEATIGRVPEGAMNKSAARRQPAANGDQAANGAGADAKGRERRRDTRTARARETTGSAEKADAAEAAEASAERETDAGAPYAPHLLDWGGGDGERENPGTGDYDPGLASTDRHRARKAPRQEPTEGGSWREVGGVQVERAEPPAKGPPPGESRVLAWACRPTKRPLPKDAPPPATPAAEQAQRAAAALESITSLSEWSVVGEEAIAKAKAAGEEARQQALLDHPTGGPEAERAADQRARRARQRALAPHADAPWRKATSELGLSNEDAHALEIVARVKLVAPALMTHLVEDHVSERAVRTRLTRLHDAGLIARADVGMEGRRGRPPMLFAIAARGLEYLRARRSEMTGDDDAPRYLQERKPPKPGRGQEVPHELAIQVALVALNQYAGRGNRMHWHTTRMPGGRWDVGMVHHDQRDRTLRLADLLPGPGHSARGEQLDAPTTLEPDLSVQLRGDVGGQRATIDLLIEVDRTTSGAYNASKFTAYDHFLGGWCLRTRRFGHERGTRPVVVFIAREAKAIPALLSAADRAMTLGFGDKGQYDPARFAYPGRTHTAFTCMEWLLGGQAVALRLPEPPPQVRGSETQMRPEGVALLPEAWWPSPRPRPGD